MLYGAGLDDVAGQQQPARQHRPEPVKEHVQTAQRRAEEPRGGHADLGVASDHRDVGHQRHLKAAAQRVSADLPHRDLRKAHQVVIEAERLAVHGQPPPLAGTPFGLGRVSLAVPAVCVIHVRPGTEHAVRATQQHDSDVVVFGDAIQVPRNGVAHRRVVRVALARVVQRDRRDPLFGIHLVKHTIVPHLLGS